MKKSLDNGTLPKNWTSFFNDLELDSVVLENITSMPNIWRINDENSVDLAWGNLLLIKASIKSKEGLKYWGTMKTCRGQSFTRGDWIDGTPPSTLLENIGLSELYKEFYQPMSAQENLADWRFKVEPKDGDATLVKQNVPSLSRQVSGREVSIKPIYHMKELVDFLDNFGGPSPMFSNLWEAWSRTRSGECLLARIDDKTPQLLQIWLNQEGWGLQLLRLNDQMKPILSSDAGDDEVSGIVADWAVEIAEEFSDGPPIALPDTKLETNLIQTTDSNGQILENPQLAGWMDENTELIFTPVKTLHQAARLLCRTAHFTRCTGKHATMYERSRPNLLELEQAKQALIMVEGPPGIVGSIGIDRLTGAKHWSFGAWILEGMIPPNQAKASVHRYFDANIFEPTPSSGFKP